VFIPFRMRTCASFLSLTTVALGFGLAAPLAAHAATTATVTKNSAPLMPPAGSPTPNATGDARISHQAGETKTFQSLLIGVSGLQPGARYTFSANSIALGTFTAVGHKGRVELEFKAPTIHGGEQFPPGFPSVTDLTSVEVTDATTNAVALSGAFGTPTVFQVTTTKDVAKLTPPSAATASTASGTAVAKFRSRDTGDIQVLTIDLRGLETDRRFVITIDGVDFGTFTPTEKGAIHLSFRDPARQGNHAFPPGAPSTMDMQLITVTTVGNDVVLTGAFEPVTDN
jgi:hypothetical protein